MRLWTFWFNGSIVSEVYAIDLVSALELSKVKQFTDYTVTKKYPLGVN